jgi:hypothetical protein
MCSESSEEDLYEEILQGQKAYATDFSITRTPRRKTNAAFLIGGCTYKMENISVDKGC